MTLPLDNSLYPRARALLDKHGLDGTLEVVTATSRTAGTGEIVKTTVSVAVKVSPPARIEEGNGPEAITTASMAICFMSLVTDNAAYAPKRGFLITIDSKKRLIENVETYRTGDLAPVYRLEIGM